MRHFFAAGVFTLALGMTLPALSVEESVDQKFAADVAKDGMAEVELGRLALNKSDNAKVREFANRMVQDHSKAQLQLEGVAKSGRIVLTSEPGETLEMPMNKLSELSDKKFDRAYAEEMVSDHEKVVKLFESYQGASSNKELEAFARETLPVLEEHLRMAQALEKSLGGK